MTYFNEIDGFCNEWIYNAFGVRPEERSIVDIQEPSNSKRQHYFAGLGGWEYALRLAGWPEDREVWTGSCPCQPFSVAGEHKGVDDERHLWPAFLRLIAIGRPATIFGEQVASKDGRVWLGGVRADLEALGYAVGAADLCAAGVGAPHIRQRLYWVAVAKSQLDWSGNSGTQGRAEPPNGGPSGGLGDSDRARPQGRGCESGDEPDQLPLGNGSETQRVADADDTTTTRQRSIGGSGLRLAEPESHWAASGSILCADGRWRRIPLEPGFQPLADDGRFGNPRADRHLSSRIGALKAAGNAICVPLAAEFIKAVMDGLAI